MREMNFEFIMAFLSFLATVIVYGLDLTTASKGGSPRMQSISRVLFSSYRRTILVYIACMQGIVVYSVLATQPHSFLDPVVVVGILILEGIVVLLSIAFARIRKKTMLGPSRISLLQRITHHQMDSPCIEELSELSSKSTTAGSASIQDLLAILNRDDPAEWLVERFVELGLSKECINELLWESFFDRFEETPLHRPRVSWFSRKEFRKYRASRDHLLSRDDEAGKVFRESLSRWSMQASGLE